MEFWNDFSGYFKIKAKNEKEAEHIAFNVLSDFADYTDSITNCQYTIDGIEEINGNEWHHSHFLPGPGAKRLLNN